MLPTPWDNLEIYTFLPFSVLYSDQQCSSSLVSGGIWWLLTTHKLIGISIFCLFWLRHQERFSHSPFSCVNQMFTGITRQCTPCNFTFKGYPAYPVGASVQWIVDFLTNLSPRQASLTLCSERLSLSLVVGLQTSGSGSRYFSSYRCKLRVLISLVLLGSYSL